MDGKLPEILKNIPHDEKAVFRNTKDRTGMKGHPGGPDSKASFFIGLIKEMSVPIFLVTASAGIGAYYFGP